MKLDTVQPAVGWARMTAQSSTRLDMGSGDETFRSSLVHHD